MSLQNHLRETLSLIVKTLSLASKKCHSWLKRILNWLDSFEH